MIALGEGITRAERRLRYIRVYHAYELLESEKNNDFKAIRHGLSHAAGALTNPRTIQALVTLFGTDSIDLSDPRHRRIYDVKFGQLVIALDGLIATRLGVGISKWLVFSPSVHVSARSIYPRYSLVKRKGYIRAAAPN